MAREYNVNEGNQIGYVPAEFGTDLSLQQKKIVAGADVTKGQVVVISGDMEVSPSTGASDAVIGVGNVGCKSWRASSSRNRRIIQVDSRFNNHSW